MNERDYWMRRAATQRTLAKAAKDTGTSRAHTELAALLEGKAIKLPAGEDRRAY